MSANLNLSQVAANQNQKEVTINDATGQIDAAITEQRSDALSGASPTITLTSPQFRAAILFILTTGTTPSGTATLTCPAIKRGFFRVRNDSSIPIDVGISGQPVTKPRVYAGTSKTLYCDGTNVRGAEGGEALGHPFDLGIFFPGTMSNNQLLCRYVFTRDVDIPSGLTGSFAKAVSAATGASAIDIRKNGSSIGSFDFAASGTIATFTFASAQSFAAGDILSIHAPASADATLADVGFTFKCTRRA